MIVHKTKSSDEGNCEKTRNKFLGSCKKSQKFESIDELSFLKILLLSFSTL